MGLAASVDVSLEEIGVVTVEWACLVEMGVATLVGLSHDGRWAWLHQSACVSGQPFLLP